jgi:capsule biosynthesis phosphatase
MIYKVIDNLNIDYNNDKIHIVYHNHLKEFNFETLIRFWFPHINISFTSLDYLTKGAAETVLKGLETFTKEELNDNVLLLDCDTFYSEDIIKHYKQSNSKNVIFYFNDTNSNPIFSYIKLENNKIIEIKEKIKISDNANTGAYGFESGNELKQYCSKILDLNQELYTSCVYDKMIKDGKIIHGYEINNFHCVGTPLQLKVYCNKNKEYTNNLRVCFDLDNTLVTHPTIAKDYSSVLPIQRNIDFLKLLHTLGNTIIIYTARRMKTHKGNVGAIVADVGRVTLDTLDKFDIPYDEIHFGKPYANFYIDDLAVNANSSLDKALGIYNIDTPSRSFNKVEYNNKTVTKHTSNEGEVYWYNNIPSSIESYFPKVITASGNKIVMEHIEGINYSYLYTNEILKIEDIDKLMFSLNNIHISSHPVFPENIYLNYASKLSKRHSEHKELYNRYNLDDIYYDILDSLNRYEINKGGKLGVIHGDPVFTKILQTKYGLKFIDMRGKQGDVCTICGDVMYEYAKIYQSLIGYYYILNNIEINHLYTEKLKQHFESYLTPGELNDIKVITASLLFTLLPLHDEDKDKFDKYIKLINTLCTK